MSETDIGAGTCNSAGAIGFALDQVVARAIAEDLGAGDVTTDALSLGSQTGSALFVARARVTVAGLGCVEAVFRQLGEGVRVSQACKDGTTLEAGKVLCRVDGPMRILLYGERIALNLLQRLSGIATLTAHYVAQVPENSPMRICDTRKTTPGLRALERYAVRCGGGHSHRDSLGAAPMLKDNHIAACGGDLALAVARVRAYAPHTARITCEVDTLAQLACALDARVDIALLDNFSDEAVKEAVQLNSGRAVLEVSGNVTPERIGTLASLGVNIVSVGALTHSAAAADIGMDWLA